MLPLEKQVPRQGFASPPPFLDRAAFHFKTRNQSNTNRGCLSTTAQPCLSLEVSLCDSEGNPRRPPGECEARSLGLGNLPRSVQHQPARMRRLLMSLLKGKQYHRAIPSVFPSISSAVTVCVYVCAYVGAGVCAYPFAHISLSCCSLQAGSRTGLEFTK